MRSRKFLLAVLAVLCIPALIATRHTDLQEFLNIRIVSADEGYMALKSNCVTDDTDSGAGTHVLTDVFPARALPMGVTCRVNTVLAGASLTTWSLGDGADADLYGATLAKTAGTTVGTANYTARPTTQAWATSAPDLTLTAAAGQFDSGNITCCGHYIEFVAPAS